MFRIVTLVLVDASGRVLGGLPPYEVPSPWWQEVADVVSGARERYGVEVAVLRVLATERPAPHGGSVTYLAESGTHPGSRTLPVDAAALDLAVHPLRAAWALPGGPAASLSWAAEQLASIGWRPALAKQQRTWNLSAIWCLDSPSGVAWLKQVPRFFAHEPTVLRWIASEAPQLVPPLLAADGNGRMLLAHVAGEDLYFAPPPELAGLIDDLHVIQHRAVTHVDALCAAGVPDKRWPVLASRLAETVTRHGPGLGPELNAALQSLMEGLDSRLSAIGSCGLPDTLGHGDFHSGNARGDGEHRVIIDWGDSFVGHPGFDALRIVDRQPPTVAALLLRQWGDRWRTTVPGCDPERALELLVPVAALNAAAAYAAFVSQIEPSERPYHAEDIAIALRAAVGS